MGQSGVRVRPTTLADGSLGEAHLDGLVAAARTTGEHEVQVVTELQMDDRVRKDLAGRGFRPVSEIVTMSRRALEEVTEDRAPYGIVMRRFDPRDAAAVHGLLDVAYPEWDSGYRPVDLASWISTMTGDAEFDPALWWVAEDDRGVAGCALFWSSGWLKDLAVAPHARRRGIAEALLRRGLCGLAEAGVGQTGLKVDASNPTGAIQLYEKLGFVGTRTEVVWELRL